MAKGFTVKAKAPAKPKAAEQEWDYDKAREMLKGKTVVFLSLIHISEPTRLALISYAVFCLPIMCS